MLDIYWSVSGVHKSIPTITDLYIGRCKDVCEHEFLQVTATYVSVIQNKSIICFISVPTAAQLHNFIRRYGLTNLAYQNLQDQNEHQCVCILGESNAGKTETARMVAHFVSQISKSRHVKSRPLSTCAENTSLMRCKSLAEYPKYEVNGPACTKVCYVQMFHL